MSYQALAPMECSRFEELESVIEQGMQSFVDVGTALSEIRDSRLYRTTHPTFEDYCRDRWGLSRAYSYRLIEAGKVAAEMSPMGDSPVTERQARELARVKDPEERRQVWREVVESGEERAITARSIREVAERRYGERENSGPPPPIYTETMEVSDAMTFAEMAIGQLERIRGDDPKRLDALRYVVGWINHKIKE